MSNLDRLLTWVQALLTRGFIRFFKRSKLEEVKDLSLLDEATTVYTFRSDGAAFAQVTIFGTVLWNETRMEQLSEKAKRLVLLHECSHRDRNSIYKGVFFGMAVPFTIGTLFLLQAVLFILLGVSPLDLAYPTAVSVVMIVVFLAMFRLEETIADYHAICELGEREFIDAYEEITSVHDYSLRARIIRKVLYSDPADTVRLYRLSRRLSQTETI